MCVVMELVQESKKWEVRCRTAETKISSLEFANAELVRSASTGSAELKRLQQELSTSKAAMEELTTRFQVFPCFLPHALKEFSDP